MALYINLINWFWITYFPFHCSSLVKRRWVITIRFQLFKEPVWSGQEFSKTFLIVDINLMFIVEYFHLIDTECFTLCGPRITIHFFNNHLQVHANKAIFSENRVNFFEIRKLNYRLCFEPTSTLDCAYKCTLTQTRFVYSCGLDIEKV